ncbi:VTT domain-containing protein [Tissierella sp. MSJ-40]|uniref:TVP38/TMEM64 family membrane protein n=1 Tax=Tissierella simiarum TaxID=2841534 RepID=A0ABS6E182_9FIRM|nr:VTT domain-containing protein [Tissierella simiarum]MBU5436601.1 VTT domain-containing protein [Tissierella simiarum]
MNKKIFKIGLIAILLGILVYLTTYVNIYDKNSLMNFITSKEVNTSFSAFFTVFATILMVFFVPISWLSAAGAYFFGMKSYGNIMISGLLASTISFFISKIFRKDVMKWINKIYNRKERKMDLNEVSNLIETYGRNYIFFLRNTPFIPLAISNYAAGITSISYKDYIIGTLFGLMPNQLISTYFFVKIANIKKDFKGVIFGTLIKGAYLTGVYFCYRKSKYRIKE